jgi:hypothetical protein
MTRLRWEKTSEVFMLIPEETKLLDLRGFQNIV